jgi:hypothetical protein
MRVVRQGKNKEPGRCTQQQSATTLMMIWKQMHVDERGAATTARSSTQLLIGTREHANVQQTCTSRHSPERCGRQPAFRPVV